MPDAEVKCYLLFSVLTVAPDTNSLFLSVCGPAHEHLFPTFLHQHPLHIETRKRPPPVSWAFHKATDIMADCLSSNTGVFSNAGSIPMRLFSLDSKPSSCYTSSSDTDENPSSLLYSALPQILQRRLPRLRSLRASVYSNPRSHLRSSSASSSASTSSLGPPPSYHTRPSTSDSYTEPDSDDEIPELFTSAPSSRPSTSGAATPAPPLTGTTRTELPELNLRDKSSRYGLTLLNLALNNPTSTPTTDPLTRRLYIDGVGYILRGLPDDLTHEETLILRTAIPETLAPPPQHHSLAKTAQPTAPPTLLHRTASLLTFYALLTLTLLLPYLQTLLQTLHSLNVRHRLTARFYAQASLLLQLFASQALALAALVWSANDGALRHACRDFGVWVLRDVCGGVDEGVGRAVVELRLEGGRGKGKEVEG